MPGMKTINLPGTPVASAWICLTISVLMLPSPVLSAPDLSRMSIEELADIEVTSVSKREQSLREAPAAIYVINEDDIRRSGATSLAETLRLAPNLLVQRIDAHQYAINARGFSGFETSNKLLGLIDGRSIYTALHAGIFWDLRELMVEDLDRIEVISGSGGTLWGTNAVNGVINVTSKRSSDTQGLLARATAGTEERTAALRYGGAVGGGSYRVYASGLDREGFATGAGPASADGEQAVRTGFRTDWGDAADGFTLQGDYFYNDYQARARHRPQYPRPVDDPDRRQFDPRVASLLRCL